MARKNMRKEMQEILQSDDCETMDADSQSMQSGMPVATSSVSSSSSYGIGQSHQHQRSTPPNSLALMPDHVFGTSRQSGSASAMAEGELESPSKVLGGTTSWTGGLSHGCAAVFRNDESGTTSVPLGSPSDGIMTSGQKTPLANRLENLKSWTMTTYKCSRQTIFEKLGKSSRTVDTELEAQIEALRDTQRKYSNILRLARALTSHLYHVVHTQGSLGEAFSDLANRSPELLDEFNANAETQKKLVKNGEQLIAALNFFVSSVNTLCNKTMEDTILTVKQYETARVEYDAYRADVEFYTTVPRNDTNQVKQREAQEAFEKQKQEFEKLRSDVQIKLKFLDENRVKVMHKQLILFHNAIAAYFSGNQTALEATMKQFSVSLKSPNSSWLEK